MPVASISGNVGAQPCDVLFPFQVGHRQEVTLGEDGKYEVITRAMKPLLFGW